MKYVKQFSIILGISFLAELLEILIPFPIAASVYGLVIMLVGLITKLIPLEKVETAADFLVDAMSIMFVPATVGIMASRKTRPGGRSRVIRAMHMSKMFTKTMLTAPASDNAGSEPRGSAAADRQESADILRFPCCVPAFLQESLC